MCQTNGLKWGAVFFCRFLHFEDEKIQQIHNLKCPPAPLPLPPPPPFYPPSELASGFPDNDNNNNNNSLCLFGPQQTPVNREDQLIIWAAHDKKEAPRLRRHLVQQHCGWQINGICVRRGQRLQRELRQQMEIWGRSGVEVTLQWRQPLLLSLLHKMPLDNKNCPPGVDDFGATWWSCTDCTAASYW